MTESIKVAVRVRPILPHESLSSCIYVSGNQLRVGEERYFAFDHVFDQQSTSDDTYVALGQPLADNFLSGYNASMIAYGQTGAGKTFTMSALTSDVVQEVFCRLAEEANTEMPPLLSVTALEIYNEALVDLFVPPGKVTPVATSPNSLNESTGSSPGTASPHALQLREGPKGGVYVANLSERSVATEEELLNLIDYATSKRKTASTLMNAYSSRSHCIVTLILSHKGIISKCSFVDLAGSERFKKSLGLGAGSNGVPGNGIPGSSSSAGASEHGSPTPATSLAGINVEGRLREGISINSGLLALGNVIVALCERRPHIPYRSSKLTRVLQPMFGGNSRTAMVACVSPVSSSFEESLNTLKYADRVKSIKTQPQFVVSTSFSADEAARTVAMLHQDIALLKAQLAAALATAASPPPLPQPQQQTSSTTSSALAVVTPRPEVTEAAVSIEVAALRVELEAVRGELAAERNLTRRLKEDLFTAEYTTMVEVEKRKVLEEQLAELDVSISNDAHNDGTPLRPNGEPQPSRATSGTRPVRVRSASVGGSTGAHTEETDEAERSRRTLVRLEQQKVEASLRVTSYTRGKERAMSEREAITRELRLAEARLEQSELARQQKEEQLRRLREEYRVRLQGAELKAADYARRASQAEQEAKARQADIDRMKSMQEKVEELRAQVQRQRTNARQQQRRTSEINLAHNSEVQQLQRQLQDAEEQRSKLENQLQHRDDELLRARNKASAATAAIRARSAGAALHIVTRPGSSTTVVSPPTPQKQQQQQQQQPPPQRGRAAAPAPAATAAAATTPAVLRPRVRKASLTPQPTQITRRASGIQNDINAAVTRLEQLERELAELLAYRATIEETRTEAMGWEKPIEQLKQQLAQVEQHLASSPGNAELAEQRDLLRQKVADLNPFQRIVAESTQQCEEFTNRIESLMETRQFYTRQVRRLQSQRDSADAEAPSSITISRNRNGSLNGSAPLMARDEPAAAPPSVSEIAHARVVKANPRRQSR